MMLKKKKKRQRDKLIAHGFCTHHQRRLRLLHHLLPPISAVSACLLLISAIFFFSSPPNTNRHLLAFKQSYVDAVNVDRFNVFRVPMSEGSLGRDLWSSKQSSLFHGCSNASHGFLRRGLNTKPNRYLMIATSGGLNQQRTGIADAVVAAYILNATLVVPKLDQKSFWKDDSNFSDIFDVEWFMTFLSKDVKIVKQLPENAWRITTTYAPRKCNENCYMTNVLSIFARKRVQVVQLKKFDSRLSNRLDPDLQKLRCRVNYHALRFTPPILEMGKRLVERMRMTSKHFVALHLRFEADMLAFTGCYYGGGVKEMEELRNIRKRWKSLHQTNPEKQRRQGKCPLSPEEMGLVLRALGYGTEVNIYVASGEVYGGEATLASLRALFPNLHTKETIATEEELAPFSPYSSRMAALDFIVCDQSDVFVANNNGNMAKVLAGKRRYFGHKPTIRPNAKMLHQLFTDGKNMTWKEFALQVKTVQMGFMGDPNEVKPGSGVFHEHPMSCICESNTTSDEDDQEYPIVAGNQDDTKSDLEDIDISR